MPDNDLQSLVASLREVGASPNLTERLLSKWWKIGGWQQMGRVKDEQSLLAMDREKGRRYVDLFLPKEADVPDDDTTILADNISITKANAMPWVIGCLGAAAVAAAVWWASQPAAKPVDTDTNTMTVLEIFRPEGATQ